MKILVSIMILIFILNNLLISDTLQCMAVTRVDLSTDNGEKLSISKAQRDSAPHLFYLDIEVENDFLAINLNGHGIKKYPYVKEDEHGQRQYFTGNGYVVYRKDLNMISIISSDYKSIIYKCQQ